MGSQTGTNGTQRKSFIHVKTINLTDYWKYLLILNLLTTPFKQFGTGATEHWESW